MKPDQDTWCGVFSEQVVFVVDLIRLMRLFCQGGEYCHIQKSLGGIIIRKLTGWRKG